ncbi:MAG: hypothetical protein ACI9HK_004855 [Pirellulaceae bacterium]|jgi:hypothetical protein
MLSNQHSLRGNPNNRHVPRQFAEPIDGSFATTRGNEPLAEWLNHLWMLSEVFELPNVIDQLV